MNRPARYDDGRISCDDQGVQIAWYYPWGAKRIPYASIRSVSDLPLSGASTMRRWRIWGSGDFVHWWNLDPRRPSKTMALVLHVGGKIQPTITPDDPETVRRIINERRPVVKSYRPSPIVDRMC